MASVTACPVQELLKALYREKGCQDSTGYLCTWRGLAKWSLETTGRVSAGWETLAGRVKCESITQIPNQGPPKSAVSPSQSCVCLLQRWGDLWVAWVQLSGLRQEKLCNPEFFPASLHILIPQVFSFALLVKLSSSPALKAAQISAPLAESRRKSALILPDECELGLPAATMGWARQSSAMPTY